MAFFFSKFFSYPGDFSRGTSRVKNSKNEQPCTKTPKIGCPLS
jgi:hypothetical protein